jgi:hypothetical protein
MRAPAPVPAKSEPPKKAAGTSRHDTAALASATGRTASWISSALSFRGGTIGGAGLGIQRKCACGGTCSRCQEEDKLQIQRAPEEGAAPLPVSDDTTAAAAPVIVEDGEPTTADQMARTEFLSLLRAQLTSICDDELAAIGRSAQGCPYITYWMDQAQLRTAAQIERAIRIFANTDAQTPQRLIDAVVSRVRASVRYYVATGQVPKPKAFAALAGLPFAGGLSGALQATIDEAPAPQGSVQTKALSPGGSPASANPAAVRARLGTGSALDSGVRSRMERGFGQTFGGVRVHTDSDSAGMAARFSSRAFTVGQHIAFNNSQYKPGTLAGDLLIAHELAHTIQQSGGGPSAVQTAAGYGALEDDADRSAVGAVGSLLGLTESALPTGRTGLQLQGCSQTVVKRCPKDYSWRVERTTGWGSFGCTCHWKCKPGKDPRFVKASPQKAYECPQNMNCSTGVKYEELDDSYEKKGYGAHMTPLTGQAFCGCFRLNFEGETVSDAPLKPTDFEMTDIAGPLVNAAAAKKGGQSQLDPRTGEILPGMKQPSTAPVTKPKAAVMGGPGADIETGLARVKGYRSLMRISEKKNVGFADYEFEKASGTVVAGSGKHQHPGTVPTPKDPQFRGLIIGHDRSLDSEKKIFEHFDTMLGGNKDAKGTIRMFSELPMCPSCVSVKSQFQEKYPNIKIETWQGPVQ